MRTWVYRRPSRAPWIQHRRHVRSVPATSSLAIPVCSFFAHHLGTPAAEHVDPPQFFGVPAIFHFHDTSDAPVFTLLPDPPRTRVWDFGDGTPPVAPRTFQVIFHTYTKPGIYTVKLTICNSAGCDTCIIEDYIRVLLPHGVAYRILSEPKRISFDLNALIAAKVARLTSGPNTSIARLVARPSEPRILSSEPKVGAELN